MLGLFAFRSRCARDDRLTGIINTGADALQTPVIKSLSLVQGGRVPRPKSDTQSVLVYPSIYIGLYILLHNFIRGLYLTVKI